MTHAPSFMSSTKPTPSSPPKPAAVVSPSARPSSRQRAATVNVSAPPRLRPYTPTAVPHDSASEHTTALFRAGSVPTRFLLVSDTHARDLFARSDARHAFKRPLPRADVLIHAGDLSTHGSLRELQVARRWIGDADAEVKLVIAGNHDVGLDRDRYLDWRRRMGPVSRSGRSKLSEEDERNISREAEEIRELWTGQGARAQGIRYLEEGVHEVELANGAGFTVYASQYSPEYYDWAFLYPRTQDRYNLPEPDSAAAAAGAGSAREPANPIPSFPAVDVMITHGPPQGILDRVHRSASGPHVGCAALLRALRRARPRLHVFGHIHEDWGMVKMDWMQGSGKYLRPLDCEDDGADEEWRDVVRRGWIGWDGTGKEGGCGEVFKGVRKEVRERGGGKEGDGEGEKEEDVKGCGEEGDDGRGGDGEDVRESEEEALDATSEGMVHDSALRWGRETLCVNAAIMNAGFNPRNAPWVVDLLLPERKGDAASDVQAGKVEMA